MTLSERAAVATNPVAAKLYSLMQAKQSNLAISLDVPQKDKFFKILERVGEHVVIVKTHIDIIEYYDAGFIDRLLALKEQNNFLIFEDRKFADIGHTVKLQYTRGLYHIIEWADLVNAHIFPGIGVIQGLKEAWQETKKERAIILIPQMTSLGNLFNETTLEKAIEWAKEHSDFVIGFIGAASKKKSLQILREKTFPEFLIYTPGVKLGAKQDTLGQTYVTPELAVAQGADIISVGRGIYESEEPGKVAIAYKQAGWNAL